jgi:hypothetical protein
MKIALHLGPHLTDDGQIVRCLLRNRDALFAQGIEVPAPTRYRDMLLRIAGSTDPDSIADDSGAMLLDSTLDGDDTSRVILTDPNVMAWKGGAVRRNLLYPAATQRLACLREALLDHEVELSLAIRNPASFLPAILSQLKPNQVPGVLATTDATALRWSQLIASIRDTWPEAALTVWCDEDTPFIWDDILGCVAGIDKPEMLEGRFDWFENVMVAGAAGRLEAFLRAHPPIDGLHRQKVIAAFLDKFCDDSKIDVDASITGWGADMIDTLSLLYDDDLADIEAIDGVTLLQPVVDQN